MIRVLKTRTDIETDLFIINELHSCNVSVYALFMKKKKHAGRK